MGTALNSFIEIFKTGFAVGEEPVRLKRIEIPIIQRDYAQGRMEDSINRVRARFLHSLHQAILEDPTTLDFVYGEIDNGIMTPLDGQQRLTTLFLLHWYAAKKENIPTEEYLFLYNFGYETRYSARDFCSYLIGFNPSFTKKLSEEIVDQAWFPLDWKKDPTISAMLVMLDAIQDEFAQTQGIWERLKNRAITFYFLPIKDMGLTDELYIKMNSRGKPLTQFEHFKAELERELKKREEDTAKRVIKKIDLAWSDMLWQYRGDDNLIDDEFLRYFKFVCDIICYQNGGSTQGKSSDEFDLLKEYFSGQNENVKANIQTLEDFFDCWCCLSGGDSPSGFLERFISQVHQAGKIKIDNRYGINIFNDCLRNYAEVLPNNNRKFPLNRTVFLYAVVVYLLNKNTISDAQFSRRLRIVNNLMQNSENEISDSVNRTSGNRMPAILKQVDAIIKTGTIDDTIERNFNPAAAFNAGFAGNVFRKICCQRVKKKRHQRNIHIAANLPVVYRCLNNAAHKIRVHLLHFCHAFIEHRPVQSAAHQFAVQRIGKVKLYAPVDEGGKPYKKVVKRQRRLKLLQVLDFGFCGNFNQV